MRRIGMGLVGPGFVAAHHIDAVRRLGYVDIVAIVGGDLARAHGIGADHGHHVDKPEAPHRVDVVGGHEAGPDQPHSDSTHHALLVVAVVNVTRFIGRILAQVAAWPSRPVPGAAAAGQEPRRRI